MENVIKQGYLKKGNTGGHWLSGLFRRNDAQKWFVFLVRDGVPYLEYYDSDVEVFSQRPINSYCLSLCRNIRAMGRSTPPTFCINCSDRFIELVASSRTQLAEWVNSIEHSLTRLGLLQKETEGNVYTVLPAVVRQPRVSKEVLEEREAMAAQAAASLSVPSQATGASSFEQSRSEPGVMSQASESTHGDIPPPVPRRPMSSASKVTSQDSSSCSSLQASATMGESSDNSSTMASQHESNSSDFVSWDVLMSIRAAGRDMERPDSKALSTSDNELTSVAESESVSCNSHFPGHSDSTTTEDNQASKVKLRPELQRGRPVELDSSDSDDCEKLSDSMDVSSPGFSLLGKKSLTLDLTHEKDSEDSPGASNNDSGLKPIPLPRWALSLRNHYDNSSVVQTAPGPKFDTEAFNPVEPERGTWNRSDHEDHSHDASTLLHRPYAEDTFCKSTMQMANDRAKENIYSPVLKHGDCEPPSSMAPPVPPLPLSSDLMASADCGEGGIDHTDVKSFEMPAEPSSSSLLRMSKSNSVCCDQPSYPPVPLPRRRPTVANKSDAPNIPPLPPRRAFSIDNNPSLPSRSSQSFFIRRPQIFNCSKADDSDGKADPRSRALPPLPLADMDEGNSASAIGTRDEAKTGALSHKMLLDRAHSLHTVVSLKQTQVEILQNEIDMPHITVALTQKSGHGLALVDWNGMPCIAGWNQKNFPTLHGKLHVGDMILSVNSIPAASPEVTQKLLRQPITSKIEVMVQRMPYANVFAIRRNAEGQSLGLKREGGTGEILYVDPNGLAAQHGLTPHAQGIGNGRSNWFLTEINSRPLNLFFKESEIEHRLCAVGREISIVVQPSDFIFEIRRQLKKVKNYKQYIVQ